MLEHLLRMEVGNKEADVVSLESNYNGQFQVDGIHDKFGLHTGIGFLRKITKFSARIIKKRVSLWARRVSISSACLILILMRRELMDGSIRTCSFSLRLIITGVKRASLVSLCYDMRDEW
jgi:hypothetical protein